MNSQYVIRNASNLAREILSDTPVLVVSGGRQTGKSTLLAHLTRDMDVVAVNLDRAPVLDAALSDPQAFVEQNPQGLLVIDEVQRAPGLLLAIKASLESNRRPGRFAITGSSNLLTLKGGEESLAGRAETINLRGFSQGELAGVKDDFASAAFNFQRKAIPVETKTTRDDYIARVSASCFPELRGASTRRQNRWLRAYLERVLTKDLPESSGVVYPDRLGPLLKVLAANNAGEFVATHVVNHVDIPVRSLPSYVAALESVFLVSRIPAWSNNRLKRVISRPKVVINDYALANYLNGVDAQGICGDIGGLVSGGLFEAFVVTELLKQQQWSDVEFDLFHFRDRDGHEVDVVLENRQRQIVGVEVKATTTVTSKHFNGLRYLQNAHPEAFVAGFVIYTGSDVLSFGPNLWALPMSALWEAKPKAV